ncbi:MAG: PSD1 and planctomycete cytochrome C domain-containing protein [Pirellulales bacterium]
MKTHITISTVALAILSMALNVQAAETQADKLFTLKVLPVLKSKCFGCHGNDADDIKGDYDVRSREMLLKGGESEEPSIIAGNPEDSPLIHAIKWEGTEMPPKENDRLTEQQITDIEAWIEAGAPWPNEKTQETIRKAEWSNTSNADGVIMSTSGGLSNEWTYRRYQPAEMWSFQPVVKPPVPAGAKHSVDAFIQAKLAANHATSAPQADPQTLIRRANYDLIGLPPKPKEIFDFVTAWKADKEKSWSDLIERLLASPQYGERWGQHWLDVVRYADTAGFSNDYERSNAWRYRDYVIRAFNSDKPYNEFVIEQLAGDELRPNDPEMKIATGYLRMGPWGTAMVKKDAARQLYLDDVVNNVGQAFLSTTMRCLKCHDHKFDPIPTRDYYRMYSTFAATQPAEMNAKFLDSENQTGFEKSHSEVEHLLQFASSEMNKLVDKREIAAKKWYEEHNLPYKNENKRKGDADDVKPPRHVGLSPEEQGVLKVRTQDEWIWKRRLERTQALAQSVYNGDAKAYNTRKLRKTGKLDDQWKPENFILMGGSVEAPGQNVGPGVLSALGLTVTGAPSVDPYILPDGVEGRRLAFARWVAAPNNQLTTRSIVNRIWQNHFGSGIAGNANNFGAKGKQPTHPKLLDYLAAEFVEQGWSIKNMHRLIMTSEAYQQSCEHPKMEKLQETDPNNHWLAYRQPRRLTAEELRDSMLLISGELNLTMGGLPARPEINMEVALQPRMIQFSLAPAYLPSKSPKERNRRTVYSYRVRGQADPFLELFNQPNPNASCELRDSASVTPQAFTLMNSEQATDRSIAFALHLQKRTSEQEEQINQAFRLALGRNPSDSERNHVATYISEMTDYHQKVSPEMTKYPTSITRSLVEELTGQPFEYEEILPVFEKYIADKKPADVNPQTRALADACLLLFNSNEFVYVY